MVVARDVPVGLKVLWGVLSGKRGTPANLWSGLGNLDEAGLGVREGILEGMPCRRGEEQRDEMPLEGWQEGWGGMRRDGMDRDVIRMGKGCVWREG